MYLIKELQTTNGVTAELPIVQKEKLNEAESEFYIKAGYAAISSVEVHTVMLFTDEGFEIKKPICYKHTAPTPTPEPEVEPEDEGDVPEEEEPVEEEPTEDEPEVEGE